MAEWKTEKTTPEEGAVRYESTVPGVHDVTTMRPNGASSSIEVAVAQHCYSIARCDQGATFAEGTPPEIVAAFPAAVAQVKADADAATEAAKAASEPSVQQ